MSYTVTHLEKPAGVNVYPGVTGMTASWTQVVGASGYKVTVSGDNKEQQFTETDGTIHIKSGLVPDTEYTLRIVAVAGDLDGPATVTTFTTGTGDTPPASTPPVDTPPVNTTKPVAESTGMSRGRMAAIIVAISLALMLLIGLIVYMTRPAPQSPLHTSNVM
jgi:hypothetical protein